MRVVALDFETNSLNYYSPTFEVTDMALSWRCDLGNMVSKHVKGQTAIGEALKVLATKNVTCIVHNLTFELGVLQAQFPEVSLSNWEMVDTQRLCQVGDAGTTQKMYKTRYREQGGETKDGLNLVACCSRWLYEKFHDHKKLFYDYLVKHKGVKKGTEGANLQLLPSEMLKDYNCADTENTLRLYEEVVKQFEKDGYTGWVTDHVLYRSRCEQLVNAFIGGVLVDRSALQTCIDLQATKLEKMEKDFREVHKDDILKCIAIKIAAYCTDPKVKTEKGLENRWDKIARGTLFGDRDTVCGFNIGSTKDLFLLYNHVLGVSTPFLTKPDKNGKGGGSPSFKRAHLPAWHESGKILQDRGTIRITKKQAESLLELSKEDSRFHPNLMATGTKTGRLSSGDGSRS